MSRRGRSGGRPGDQLYAIAGVATRRVKIGRAVSAWARLEQLQSASPDPLVLLAFADGRGIYEGMLHEYWSGLRLHGEWFSPRLTEEIASRLRTIESPYPSEDFTGWVDLCAELWRLDEDVRAANRVAPEARPTRPAIRRGTFIWRGRVRNHAPGGGVE